MKSLLKVFKYLKPYSGWFILSFILLLISTGINLLQPKLSQLAVDSGIGGGNMRVVVLSAAAMLLSGILGAFFNLVSGRMLIKSAQAMSYDLRNSLYRKVSSFSFADFDKWRTGELIVRMNSDVETVRMFIRMGLFMLIQSFFMIAGSLAAMYSTETRLARLMTVIMVGTFVLFLLLSQIVRPVFLKVRKALDNVNNVLQENLAGAGLVRAMSRQDSEKAKFGTRNTELYRISVKVGLLMGTFFPLLMFIGNGALLATLWFGGRQVVSEAGSLTLGGLIAFNNYAMMAVFPILMLAMVLNFIAMAIASADRIVELLDAVPSITEKPGCVSPSLPVSGRIEFRNVGFRYGGGEKALDGINLTIEAGETIGIIGATGSGKSTLAHLIPRFLEACEGCVLLDGTDVKDLSFDSLRGNIVTAMQETVLFSGSIRDNIRYGKPDASESEIIEAAEKAMAWDFISEKPGGLDEEAGERGSALSGGQRQRIAIARSIIAAPPVLILDDVTSALDLETEAAVLSGLFDKKRRSTLIIISQKISAVRNADRILVMDKGKIAASGSHEELLRSCSIYREIDATQSIMVE